MMKKFDFLKHFNARFEEMELLTTSLSCVEVEYALYNDLNKLINPKNEVIFKIIDTPLSISSLVYIG